MTILIMLTDNHISMFLVHVARILVEKAPESSRLLSRVKRYFVRILPEITAGPANAERSTSEEESILEKFGKVKHTTAWTERGALLPASSTSKTPNLRE